MSKHIRSSRWSMRAFTIVNAMILVGLAVWILEPTATAPAPDHRAPVDREDRAASADLAGVGATASPSPSQPPTKAEVIELEGVRFGISAPEVPWSSRRFAQLSDAAGSAPTLVQFFVNWTHDYPAETVEASYQRGALPVLSWEPWAGLAYGESQPEYALSRIIDGSFDEYLRDFAEDVRDHGLPLVIRLAHEMNGTWYPWSESNSGNQLGEYVSAWRHIHDVFETVGATEVIWLWSPNILRPVPNTSLAALYPGDTYVDWVGMVGYAVEETTAGEVFDATRQALRQFTDKPLVITETGAEPGPNKVTWIRDFFQWLDGNSDVIGFIWFEYDVNQGGNADWRFTASPEATDAFQEGLSGVTLALPPVPAGSEFP